MNNQHKAVCIRSGQRDGVANGSVPTCCTCILKILNLLQPVSPGDKVAIPRGPCPEFPQNSNTHIFPSQLINGTVAVQGNLQCTVQAKAITRHANAFHGPCILSKTM